MEKGTYIRAPVIKCLSLPEKKSNANSICYSSSDLLNESLLQPNWTASLLPSKNKISDINKKNLEMMENAAPARKKGIINNFADDTKVECWSNIRHFKDSPRDSLVKTSSSEILPRQGSNLLRRHSSKSESKSSPRFIRYRPVVKVEEIDSDANNNNNCGDGSDSDNSSDSQCSKDLNSFQDQGEEQPPKQRQRAVSVVGLPPPIDQERRLPRPASARPRHRGAWNRITYHTTNDLKVTLPIPIRPKSAHLYAQGDNQVSENIQNGRLEKLAAGKTFDQWLQEKRNDGKFRIQVERRKDKDKIDVTNIENLRHRERRLSYQEWLTEKEIVIDSLRHEHKKMEEEKKRQSEMKERRKHESEKKFDDWLMKKFEKEMEEEEKIREQIKKEREKAKSKIERSRPRSLQSIKHPLNLDS